MVASDSFAEFLKEQLAPLGRVTMRRMFGKDRRVLRRLDVGDWSQTTRSTSGSMTAIRAFQKLRPFRRSTTERRQHIDLSFWRAPERLFDEPDELVTWGE